MEFWGDERAVTVQIGAIFLLGFVVITLSIFQVTVVPQENKEVEFSHSQRIQDDMLELRSSVASAGGGGSSPPVAVEVGATYPPRSLFINPAPASGSLRTVDRGTLKIINARAEGDTEVRDYWNGSNQTFTSKALVYEPNYNVYQSAPNTTVEGWVAYNRFDSGRALPISTQTLLQGRTITVVTINGSLAASQAGTVTIDPRAVSASTRTVALNNSTAGNITLTVPTQLSVDEWRGLLADQQYNASVDTGPTTGTVNVTLEGNQTYNLRMAKVGFGTGVEDESVHYLDDVRTLDGTVANDSSSQVTLEARDRYNNPVSGVQVAATATNLTGGGSPGGFPSASDNPAFETTEADGRATFNYTAPSEAPVGGARINLTYNIKDGEPYTSEAVSQVVEVREFVSGGGSGGGGGGDPSNTDNTANNINPNNEDAVILTDSEALDTTNCGNGKKNNPCNASVTLENLDSSRAQYIESIRFNFYDLDASSNSPSNPPAIAEFTSRDTNNDSAPDWQRYDLRTANNGGKYNENMTVPVSADGSVDIFFEFYQDTNKANTFGVSKGDFFIISVIIETPDGDRRASTYFISPTV